MSHSILPVFRTLLPPTKPETSGKFLALEFEILDQIAHDHDLTPFTAFTDQRDFPEDFDGSAEDLDVIMGPCEDWFPAAVGRQAMVELAAILRDRPDVAAQLDAPEGTLKELDDLIRVLQVADEHDVEFRLDLN